METILHCLEGFLKLIDDLLYPEHLGGGVVLLIHWVNHDHLLFRSEVIRSDVKSHIEVLWAVISDHRGGWVERPEVAQEVDEEFSGVDL